VSEKNKQRKKDGMKKEGKEEGLKEKNKTVNNEGKQRRQ
jgi:hypothetical protein